jgi:Fe-S cluster biogenesis protein NfuA
VGSPSTTSADLAEPEALVERLCKDVLAPLVEADGGKMFLVSASFDDIHIHLSGTCAGCPGSSYTATEVLAPVFAHALPKAKLFVTTGWIIPPGALPVGSAEEG